MKSKKSSKYTHIQLYLGQLKMGHETIQERDYYEGGFDEVVESMNEIKERIKKLLNAN